MRKFKKALEAQLIALANGEGRVIAHNVSEWASITFAGTRHEVTLEFKGADGVAGYETMLLVAPDHEFNIPEHLVADLHIKDVGHRFGEQETMNAVLSILCLKGDP